MPRLPKFAPVLVELGRAISLSVNGTKYTWPKKDRAILCCNDTGTRLYILTRPKRKVKTAGRDLSKAKRLFSRFNHYLSDDLRAGKEPKVKVNVGRATAIVYESDKFGPLEHYIHEFERFPIVWADRKKQPRTVLTTGGKLAITARGIEG